MVNSYYISVESEIKQVLQKEKTLELKDFLTPDEFNQIVKKAKSVKLKKSVDLLSHSFSKSEIQVPAQVNDFIKDVIGKAPTTWEIFSFGHKNYTVVHDQALESPGIDIIFDLTEDWDETWGASIVYVDGSGSFSKIMPEKNKLVLAIRDKKRHRFVQYVNHQCGKKKRLFLIARIDDEKKVS